VKRSYRRVTTIKQPIWGRINKRYWWGILSIIIGIGIWLGINISNKLVLSEWSGWEPYRILLVSRTEKQPLWLINYYPQTNHIGALSLPENLVVEAAHNYGDYQLRSVVTLGKQEGWGNTLLRDSVTQALGLGVRAVVELSSLPPIQETGAAFNTTQTAMFELIKQSTVLGTVPLRDSLRVWWAFKKLHEGDFTMVDMALEPIKTSATDVDGKLLDHLDVLRWDAFIDMWQRNYIGVKEPLTVAIENTTDTPGLGISTKRILSGDGWDVIRVSDSDDMLLSTIVLMNDQELYNAPMIKDMHWLLPKAEYRVGNTDDYRSEVVVRIGQQNNGWWK
jgi:hypothetical protein